MNRSTALALSVDRRHMLAVALGAGMLSLYLCAPSVAAATFRAPEGCRLEMTIQSRGCTVSQIYRCSADPDGTQHSAIFAQDGLTYQSTIDFETRWIESSDPQSGLVDRLVDQARDHASFSELLATGRDDFDFWTQSNSGERLHHVGQDLLTGEKVTIDGVALEKTRFELTTSNEAGEVLIQRKGQQFISRANRRFYGGVEEYSDWTGEAGVSNDSPVTFDFPGEPGFGATEPQYDCDMMMAQLSAGGGA